MKRYGNLWFFKTNMFVGIWKWDPDIFLKSEISKKEIMICPFKMGPYGNKQPRDEPSQKIHNAIRFCMGWILRFNRNWCPRAVYPPWWVLCKSARTGMGQGVQRQSLEARQTSARVTEKLRKNLSGNLDWWVHGTSLHSVRNTRIAIQYGHFNMNRVDAHLQVLRPDLGGQAPYMA